jgi:hypothetical protein
MAKVQSITKVPLRTLSAWRERIRVDPEWHPTAEHFSENARVFPHEIEEHMANFMRVNYADDGRSLTRTTLQPLILILVQDLLSQGILGQDALNLQCSYHFIESFLQRLGLSFRRARPETRPAIDDDECAQLMTDLLLAFQLSPPDHIVNCDESNWFLVMAGAQTVPRGATGEYQPVDSRVFGALKSKGMAKLQRRFMEHYGGKCTKAIAAELLLQSWAELSDSVFIAAWDYEETPDEDDEEAESLDEGFHLDMAQEEILEMRRQPPEDESDEEEDNE